MHVVHRVGFRSVLVLGISTLCVDISICWVEQGKGGGFNELGMFFPPCLTLPYLAQIKS